MHGSRQNAFSKSRIEPLEAVISIGFSGSYKSSRDPEFERLETRDQSEIQTAVRDSS
jgi:hypothetical protein